MLALPPSVGYINEPFKLKYRPGICNKRFAHWFTYVTDENQDEFYEPLRRTVDFQYDFIAELKHHKDFSLTSTIKKSLKWRIFQTFGVRPLLKDPIALFSAEWLANTFDMKVIVLIRHPAAFASSLKRYNHTFPFSDFLEQPLLMRDHLQPFASKIEQYAHEPPGIIDQATLLWRCFYHTISGYQQRHPDWFFIRHEDISRDPQRCFQDLYNYSGLKFTPFIRATVSEYSGSTNPSEIPGEASHHHIRLNSQANILNWKNRLTEQEIAYIRHQVGDVSMEYYTDNDW